MKSHRQVSGRAVALTCASSLATLAHVAFPIKSNNKNLDGFDGAAMSYVEYFYALAR